jgi:hypothetical protein
MPKSSDRPPGSPERGEVLRRAEGQGAAPGAIWLRYLSANGLNVANCPLQVIASRHGLPGELLQRAWEDRLIAIVLAANDAAGRPPNADPPPELLALVTVRDGPREALLLLPDVEFDAAMRLSGMDPDGGAADARRRPGARRLLAAVGSVVRRGGARRPVRRRPAS